MIVPLVLLIMDLKILNFLVTFLILSRLTHQITTPEDRCAISESGFVCLDCFARGACFLNDEEDKTYTVIFESMCPNTPSQIYCDDTISDPQDFGSCSLLATDTNCSCSPFTKCIADVNNPSVLIQCEDDMPMSDPPCSFPSLDLNSCSCSSFSEDVCVLIDDPNDDCEKFFLKSGSVLTPFNCPDGTCFNQTSCGCVKAPIKCTSDCPLVDDPNDDCGNFFVCSGTNVLPAKCANNACFDQESCGCVVREETSSKPPTTTTTPPPDCLFRDDPNDDCEKYFVLNGTNLIPVSCVGTLCYNSESCACVEPIPTCPEGCPFTDDPNDDCRNYYVCSGSELTPYKCTENQCFDQASCGCVEREGSSTTTTTTTSSSSSSTSTTPLTCTSDCPFVDDPRSCQSYFVCSDANLVQINCTGSLCFDQESCGCVEKTSTEISSSTTITAIPPTPTACPSGCPFIDNPYDKCSKFYVCDLGNLVSHECPGGLCFNQQECQCGPN